jgi:hypothetical protein
VPIVREIGAVADEQHQEHQIAVEQEAEVGGRTPQEEGRRNQGEQPETQN